MDYLRRLVQQLCSPDSNYDQQTTPSHRTKRLISPPDQNQQNNLSGSMGNNQKLLRVVRQHCQQLGREGRPAPVEIPRQEGKKLLLLDLDKTVIFYSLASGLRVRPYLKQFLQQVSRDYVICLFTAATRSYLSQVIALLQRQGVPVHLFTRLLTRQSCLKVKLPQHRTLYIKDLTLISNWLPSQVVIVDDTPVAYCLNPENAVPIVPYQGQQGDQCLVQVSRVLAQIAQSSDVRACIVKKYMGMGKETASKNGENSTIGSVSPDKQEKRVHIIEDKRRKTQ